MQKSYWCLLLVRHRRMYNTMYQKYHWILFFGHRWRFGKCSWPICVFHRIFKGGPSPSREIFKSTDEANMFLKVCWTQFRKKSLGAFVLKGFGTSAHEPAPPAPAQRVASSIHQTQKRRICIFFLKPCNGPEGIAVFLPIGIKRKESNDFCRTPRAS